MRITGFLDNSNSVTQTNKKQISKFNLFVLLIMLFASKSALSASAGLGVSLNNAQSFTGFSVISPTILIPLEVTPYLLIEPFLSYNTFKDTDINGSYKVKNTTFGLGIFGTHSLGEKVSSYYGAKLSKSMYKTTSSNEFGSSTSESDNLTITPLVGFKYDATKSISAAFELGINFIDGEDTNDINPSFNSDAEETSLYAGLAMRYLFK